MWTIDLAQAGKAPARSVHHGEAGRQGIVSFEGRDGNEGRYAILMTFPDDETVPEEPATQRQHDAVVAYYGEGPANWEQAGYLMSAWNFAEEIKAARNFPFTAPRRALIHVATAAYLLGHPELRVSVRNWSDHRWRSPGRAASIEKTAAWRPALRFAADMIADMRAAGAAIFG